MPLQLKEACSLRARKVLVGQTRVQTHAHGEHHVKERATDHPTCRLVAGWLQPPCSVVVASRGVALEVK